MLFFLCKHILPNAWPEFSKIFCAALVPDDLTNPEVDRTRAGEIDTQPLSPEELTSQCSQTDSEDLSGSSALSSVSASQSGANAPISSRIGLLWRARNTEPCEDAPGNLCPLLEQGQIFRPGQEVKGKGRE